jgi:hypothetical protein
MMARYKMCTYSTGATLYQVKIACVHIVQVKTAHVHIVQKDKRDLTD